MFIQQQCKYRLHTVFKANELHKSTHVGMFSIVQTIAPFGSQETDLMEACMLSSTLQNSIFRET